jgi:hypothetical protein
LPQAARSQSGRWKYASAASPSAYCAFGQFAARHENSTPGAMAFASRDSPHFVHVSRGGTAVVGGATTAMAPHRGHTTRNSSTKLQIVDGIRGDRFLDAMV